MIEFDTVITKPFYPADVKKLRVKEDWYFDRQRSVFEVTDPWNLPVNGQLC